MYRKLIKWLMKEPKKLEKKKSWTFVYKCYMQLEHLTKCQSLNEELKQVNDKHLRKEEMSLIVDSHFFFQANFNYELE